ncbi:MAG: alpha/beta fold hydrolase [Planctomycetes bacterium]|nr:alpha/beta fold hydrolase [Planctomycetota bacterium]
MPALVPGEGPAEAEVRCVVSSDGYRLHYRVWPAAARRATVALVNGVMSHSLWFEPLAGRLARAGLHVVGADRRGSGLNDEARGDAPSSRILVDDLDRILRRETEATTAPLVVVGWCWGAALAVVAALEFGPRIAGLALLAPGLFPSEAILGAMRSQDSAMRSSPADAPCLVSPIREEQFTTGPALKSFILPDARRLRAFTPRFFRAMRRLGIDAVLGLARLQQPTLVLLASRDEVVANARTARAFRSLSELPVTIAACDCAHAMQLDEPEAVSIRVLSWIDDLLRPHSGRPLSSMEERS